MNKYELKNKIQNDYNGKNLNELKSVYGAELVEKYIENQLCINCEKFAEYFDPEQECAECHKGYARHIEVLSWHSDNDSIRRFGEQLAGLDDDEVALYEREFERQGGE